MAIDRRQLEEKLDGLDRIRLANLPTPLYRLDPKLMDLGVKIRLIHTPRWLVRRALRAMFRRRRIVSPSYMNLWLPALVGALPGPLVEKLWKKWK